MINQYNKYQKLYQVSWCLPSDKYFTSGKEAGQIQVEH